jgi:hypothetical protein
MITDFEYVDLVLENCDYYRILPEDIIFLTLDNIYLNVSINHSGQLIETRIASSVEIHLNNKDYLTEWEQKEYGSLNSKVANFQKRMEGRDITSVCIKSKNRKEYDQYYVEVLDKLESNGLGLINMLQINEFKDDEIIIKIKNLYK